MKSLKLILQSVAVMLLLTHCSPNEQINIPPKSPYDLHFDDLSKVWDEAIPLGNGMIGALVWEKEGKLRFSLDRADLWDLRPMENLNTPEWKYSWVYEQWKSGDYRPVQEKFDVPYDKSPAPSKIPGAALEFDVSELGEVDYVHLYTEKAICEIKWKSGARLLTFVHATDPVGWYRFEGVEKPLDYELLPPAYNLQGKDEAESPVTGQDLRRLNYPEGKVVKADNTLSYRQEGWGGFKYQVETTHTYGAQQMTGVWSISSEFPGWSQKPTAAHEIKQATSTGMSASFHSHEQWWDSYWAKAGIQVPDETLQRQWQLEMYKFGSVARADTPPISLQAVWTADNGKLPPWKGDFHHDLNTQLSYWPAYSGNRLDLEEGFVNWLWQYRHVFKEYTSDYFETEGLNVPGVSTLTGEPMGGWIQYSFGPTVSAWLGHHFYMHWRYSMDREFLKQKAYPWLKDVAIYLEQISVVDEQGQRKLPISSSPEVHNNSREAWFDHTTNFDLALIRWTYEKAAELAQELGQQDDEQKWRALLAQWPELATDKTGLLFAPGHPYDQSHRHFSHQVGYHPLGIVDVSKGAEYQEIIENTIQTLEEKGSDYWVGYSFSWMANLKARAFDGEGAAEQLRKFATSFCLPNSFHVNGDQSGNGYSKFTYRPFTLEGNFAFAAGLQEMLIQSHTGVVHLFPAIPSDWQDVSFDQLRAEGAFVISAKKEKGQVTEVRIKPEKGGILKLKNPFERNDIESTVNFLLTEGNVIEVETEPGKEVLLKQKQ